MFTVNKNDIFIIQMDDEAISEENIKKFSAFLNKIGVKKHFFLPKKPGRCVEITILKTTKK